MKSQAANVIDQLETYLTNKGKEIDGMLINERIATDLFNELRFEVKEKLAELFGPESDARAWGEFSSVYEYKAKKDSLDDGLLLAYWSHRGEPITNKTLQSNSAQTGVLRENLFYKGTRWSDQKKYNDFYKGFQWVRETVQSNLPVVFLAHNGLQRVTSRRSPYLKVVAGFENRGAKPGVIRIPINDVDFRLAKKSKAFNRLRNYVLQLKAGRNGNRFSELIEDTVKDARTNKHLKRSVNKWRSEITKEFPREVHKFINAKSVVSLVAAFQHYDFDPLFAIHVFLPQTKDKGSMKRDGRFPAMLGLVTRDDRTLSESRKEELIRVSTALRRLAYIEFQIWCGLKDNVFFHSRWKRIFEEARSKYEAFGNAVLGFCKVLCKENKVPVSSITMRVKDFESFYTKMFNEANRPKDSSIKNESPKSVAFKRWIQQCDDDAARLVFESLKDVVGVRITCTFEDDVKKLARKLTSLRNKGELAFDEKNDYKEHPEKEGDLYRAIHVTVKFGKKRENIYEYKDFSGLRCEIQIRSVLSHGWAEVDHDLFYKTPIPKSLADKIVKKEKIDKDRARASDVLQQGDKLFVLARNKYLKKIDEHLKKDEQSK